MTVVLVADEGIYYNILYTTLFHHINDSILCNDITAGPDEWTRGWDGVRDNDCGDWWGWDKFFAKICVVGTMLGINYAGMGGDDPMQASSLKIQKKSHITGSQVRVLQLRIARH